MPKPALNFFSVLKYFGYFVVIAVHVQMLRGTTEVLPLLIPALAEEIPGQVSEKYQRSRRSQGGNSASRISYYVVSQYTHQGHQYHNEDLVSEDLYDQVSPGQAVTVATLRGFPQVGMMQANRHYGLRNTGLLVSILVAVDLLLLLIIRRFRRRHQPAAK